MDSLGPGLILALGCGVACAMPAAARLRTWIFGAACVAALVLFAARFAIVPEDTFISMRYARHLAAGDGLVWNVGETPRVEGYTNFLWTVLLAGVHVVGAPPLESAVFLSVASGAATVVVMLAAARRLWGDGGAVAASAAAIVLLPAFWDGAGAGLETSMYAFLVTAAAAAHAVALREGRTPGLAAFVPAALAALTRPEGVFAAGLLAVGSAWAVRKDRTAVRRHAAILASVVAVVAVHVLWRRAYYGEWLPNTFYCKVGSTFAQVRRGAEQFLQFLRTGNGLLLAPCALVPWLVRRHAWMAPLAVLGAGYTAYVVAVGGDNFWRNRYLVAVLPALLLVSEGVVRHLAAAALAELPRVARGALAGAAVLALWGSVDGIKLRAHERSLEERTAWSRTYGAWLTANTPPGRAVAVFAAGVVPYHTDRPVIDMMGLCDHHIARVTPPDPVGTRNAGHEKYDFDYVIGRDPEFILMGVPDDLSNADSLLHSALRRDPGLRGRILDRYEPFTAEIGGARVEMLRRRR